MSILRIDIGKLTTTYSEFPERFKMLGGRGLTSTIVSEEVPKL